MPIIQMHIVEGRDDATKKKMVEKVTAAVVETLECPPEKVRIIISEMQGNSYSVGGKLLQDFDPRYKK